MIGEAIHNALDAVSVIHDSKIVYPQFPYDPPKIYPELEETGVDQSNMLYPNVRKLLCELGLDAANFGRAEWNPLGDLVGPGSKIMIKPNWVLHFNPLDPCIDSLVTHSSVLRVILDYACKALQHRGRITIGDAPLQSCDFNKLLKLNRAVELVELYRERYPDIEFRIVDLRKTVIKSGDSKTHFKSNQIDNDGDPEGYSLVDISTDSLLMDLIDRYNRFRVTCYDHNLLTQHHNPEKNEYLVANSILQSDLIINLGKMKSHKKAGLTGAMKNLIGINGHKEYLPHHITGSPMEGGDQYIYPSRLKSFFNKVYDRYWSSNGNAGRLTGLFLIYLAKLAKLISPDDGLEGSWYGNETIPRTTIDLNHVAYYYDVIEKKLSKQVQRKALHIIDGVVAGEGNGPVTPKSKHAGVLIAGFNPAHVDYVMARLMGYNPLKIKTLFYALNHKKSFITNGSGEVLNGVIFQGGRAGLSDLPNLNFEKPKYWTQAE